jgi:triosephosphate isomerase
MQRPVFAANWKMNHGPSEARTFISAFLSAYKPRKDRTVALFPPTLSLSAVKDALGQRRDILVGVQNIHFEQKGAFTGENSAAAARDAGAQLVLVGHSERRHVFGESDETVGKKVVAALSQGLVPMLCVGEKIEQRKSGETESVILRQLRAGLSGVAKVDIATMLIAYEPVWAIGTGLTTTPSDATTVHAVIRSELGARLGNEASAEIPILYGGSVNQENARGLLDAKGVDGLLVGGASLDASSWAAIAST